jgi:uncharacterized membrane protein
MTAGEKAKMKPWLKALLIGSLALNLLIAGLAAGAAIRFRDGKHMRPPPSVGSLIFRDLDRETRKALRQQAGGDHQSYKARKLAEFDAMLELLRATPFDVTAAEARLTAAAQHRQAFQLMVQRAWLQQVADMSDAERLQYAADLQEMLEHGRRYRGGYKDRHHD